MFDRPSAPPASAPKENHEEAAQVSDERSVERSELSRLRARGVGENPPSNKAASARTVTRYRLEFDVGAVREVGIHAGVSLAKGTHVVLYAEVAALLTTLAGRETKIDQLIVDWDRENKLRLIAEDALAEAETEITRLKGVKGDA